MIKSQEPESAKPKEEEIKDETPSKYIEYPLELIVNSKIVYIDFEGRSESKSIKNIIAQVDPRKLVRFSY